MTEQLSPIDLRAESSARAVPAEAPRWSPLDVTTDIEGALILVVDDNPRNVDVLIKLLAVKGYEPAVASSGERAIELAGKLQPALILLDVEMPGMSGFNVCRILTSQPLTQHIPIIFVTGHTGQVAAALEAGAVDFIPKPVQAADLYAGVGTRLRMEALQQELRHANQALTEANAHLEDRVAARTQELEIANGELTSEINLRQLVSDRLNYLTTHDPLTRLPNAKTFADSVIELTGSGSASAAYLRFEIDRLDLVVARQGERMVELVFTMLSSAIRAQPGDGWIAGRVDDRSIALISASADREVAEVQARSIIARFEAALVEQNTGIECQIIAGITVAEDTDCSLSDLDHAARQAIAEGTESRAQVVFSRADDLLVSRDIHMWLDRIVDGIANDHFTLFGQPVVGLGALAGRRSFELLMRWRDPETDEIAPPGRFLPIAERHRLMGELDRWAVCTAIDTLNAGFLASGTSLAVNLSGQSLSEIGFGEWLLEAVSRLTVPHAHLIFEITEQSAVRHIDRVHDLFSRLHRLGHRLALDDFGTGFASYSYLKAMPVDALKIDRSFIAEVCTDPVSAEMVRSMNELGHALGLTTVAEGVENQAVLDQIQELGLDFAQGWHLGRPAPLQAN
jgi:EAL domain-containing protein (putative c-di-GMP-specific phosphodiesterase class I)/CheY-like chemotaxis protein